MSTLTTIGLSIKAAAVMELAEGVLTKFCAGFLSPRVMEVHLPGRRVHRFPWSLDVPLGDKAMLQSYFPGEMIKPGTQFTEIAKTETVLQQNVESTILEQLRHYHVQALEDCISGSRAADDILWTFWGLCHIAYCDARENKEGWFLRQRLSNGQFVPICELRCSFGKMPIEEFELRIEIASTVWSRDKCVTQSEIDPASINANVLARQLKTFILGYPEALVKWHLEREGKIDLAGAIPDELLRWLGPTGVYAIPK